MKIHLECKIYQHSPNKATSQSRSRLKLVLPYKKHYFGAYYYYYRPLRRHHRHHRHHRHLPHHRHRRRPRRRPAPSLAAAALATPRTGGRVVRRGRERPRKLTGENNHSVAQAATEAPRAKDEQQQREISPPEQGFTRFVVDNMHAG